MEVLLDTNFIISCIIKKIDFLEELKNMGLIPVLPREVIEELKDLKKGPKITHEEREAIGVALQLFSNTKIKKIKLGNKKVDDGLIEKGQKGIYIATLDNGIKSKIPNKVVILSAQKKLAIEKN